MSAELYFSIVFFVFGLLLGSFYNVVGMRVPNKQSISYPNSHCPVCKTPLKWFELVPFFSYLGLRGKCRTCKTAISPMYPFMEMVTGLLFLAVYQYFGLAWETLYALVLVSMLVVLTVSDLKTMLIPNKVLVGFGVFLVPLSIVVMDIPLLHQVAGLALAFGINWLIVVLSKGKGIGGGDVKLFMLLGFLFGPKVFLSIFFCSVVIGLVMGVAMRVKSSKSEFPFGPSIAMATVANLFYAEQIIEVYLKIF